ncbi:MAG: tetratricopeptide repeat protein [Rhodospirillaceae bacterium]|nr:tetratricopeptide repeat protein [Rhodospirillaceae bacterium]
MADAYREALRLDELGQYSAARKLCRQILKQSPGHAEIHHLLGVIALHEKRPDDAIQQLKQTLKLKPDLAEAAFHLSLVYREKGRWGEWLAALETVHNLQKNRADILIDMGYALEMLKDQDGALARYRQAIQIDPNAAAAHSNIAAILIRRGALEEAERHLQAALAITPDAPLVLMNLAMLHDTADRRDSVIATYDRVIQLQPDHAYAPFQRSLALMAQGRLTEGWAGYTSRFHRPDSRTLHTAFKVPFWQGESLDGRKLLVWTEQGPGDEILLASMIPEVLARGAMLTLVCSPRLAPVFQRSFPACRVISNERLKAVDGAGFDYQASFSELGRHLRPDLASFPSQRGYLTADPALSRKLRAAYQAGGDDKLVGIAWHSANPTAESQKSIPLEAWTPLLAIPGIRFINLQYGDHRKDAKTLRDAAGREIIADNAVDALNDIDRFAAQVAAMDHVVSVSNTAVHVAGALGVPTSTMIPAAFGRIWYWFHDRTDSPWYPTMTLFRQRAPGEWGPTLAAVAQDLSRKLGLGA